MKQLIYPYEQQVLLAKQEYEEGLTAIKSVLSAWSRDYQEGLYAYDGTRGALVRRVHEA